MAKILVADDNSNIQKMVALALKGEGIEVVAVGNGEAAVRRLPDLRPDLVLADIFMPVRNGYEVCEFVKHDSRLAHIPVILLVGAFDPLDEQEAQRVGADGVLKKPFVPPDPLITMVKSVLAKGGAVLRAPAPAPARVPGAPAKPAPQEFEAQVSEAELVPEPFAVRPERITFNEFEKPLAFGELLETPIVEAEPQTPAPSQPNLEESKFWEAPAAEEIQTESGESRWVQPERPSPWTSEPVSEESAQLETKSAGDLVTEESAPAPVEVAPLSDLANSADEWLASTPAQPVALPPEAAESWDSTASTAPEPTPAASAQPEGKTWVHSFEHAPEPDSPTWPPMGTPGPEAPSASAPNETPVASPGSVSRFPAPPEADPQMVEAIATRVVERMQPQIIDIVTREILKPVVEALVRRELDRKKTEEKT